MRHLGLLVLTLAAAAPAGAQIAGRHDYGDVRVPDRLGHDGRLPGPSIAREARDLRGDIRDLRDSGVISRREARRMTREANVLGRTRSLSTPSARVVEAQMMALRSRVAAAQVRPRSGN